MSLKQRIKEQKILKSGAVDLEFILPGEPLIYSIKYPIGSRTRFVQFYRNKKWQSMLKCVYRAYHTSNIPLVLILKFYVTPRKLAKLTKAQLKSEKIPAAYSFELADYLLSFLELIHHVLINSYCQIVKIEMEKYYSNKPRTAMKFMKWEHYVELQNNNTLYPKGKSLCQDVSLESLVQSEPTDNADH